MDRNFQDLTLQAHLAEFEEANQHADLLAPESAPAALTSVSSPSRLRPEADLILGYTSDRDRNGAEGARPAGAVPGDGEIPDQRQP